MGVYIFTWDSLRNYLIEDAADKNFAPEAVYQSQRLGQGVTYRFADLTPGETYTVRCHFADFIKRPENAGPSFVRVGAEETIVSDEAGGLFKPLVKDYPNYKADDNGSLRSRVNADGLNLEYIYDAANRLDEIIHPSYIGTRTHAFTYDAAGNPLSANTPSIKQAFTYDVMDRVATAANNHYDYGGNKLFTHTTS